MIQPDGSYPAGIPRMIDHTRGQRVIGYAKDKLTCLDPVHRRAVWTKPLSGKQGVPNGQNIMSSGGEESLEVYYNNNLKQKIFQVGPIDASYACYVNRDGMTAIDPGDGRVLWTRSDV